MGQATDLREVRQALHVWQPLAAVQPSKERLAQHRGASGRRDVPAAQQRAACEQG